MCKLYLKIFLTMVLFYTTSSLLAIDYEYSWMGSASDNNWENLDNWNVTSRKTWESEKATVLPAVTDIVDFRKSISLSSNHTIGSILSSYGSDVVTFTQEQGVTFTVDCFHDNNVISLRNNSNDTAGHDGGFVFDGGMFLFTKTADGSVGTNTVNIAMTENSSNGKRPKTITFNDNTSIVSTENLSVSGYAASQSFVNINGNFKAIYNDVYKKFSISKANFKAGLSSNIEVGAFNLESNSIAEINGIFKVATIGATTINNSALTIASADNSVSLGQLKLSGSSTVNINSSMTITPTGLATNSNNVQVDSGSVLNINSAVKLVASTNSHNMMISGTVNLLSNGSLESSGGYGNIIINDGGVLRLASGEKTFNSGGSSIRLSGGGRVIFDSANVYYGSTTRNHSIWLGSTVDKSSVKMSYIDVNNLTSFVGICFGMNGNTKGETFYGASTTITFGDSPNSILELDYLSVQLDTCQGFLWNEDSKLVLVNFSNGKIRLKHDLRAQNGEYFDNLNLISAEGYEDGSFRVELNEGDGYYYLIGTAIPEPAIFGIGMGIIAIGIILIRRRKV